MDGVKVADRGKQGIEMIDDPVRGQFSDGSGGVAKTDGDDRHACGLGCLDVDFTVPDHDGAIWITPRETDRTAQVIRVWLADGEGVTSGKPVEVAGEIECREQGAGQAFALICADGKPRTACAQGFDGLDDARVGAALAGDVVFIIGQENFQQAIDVTA